MRSPTAHAFADRFLHARILIKAQKAVRAEVDDRTTVDHHFAVRPEFVDDDVFEVNFGEIALEVLDEADQSVLMQSARQVIQWRARHPCPLCSSSNGAAFLLIEMAFAKQDNSLEC